MTTPLAASAGDAAIEAALNALPGLAPGGVRVSGSGPFTVRFVGTAVAGATQPLLAVDSSGLIADGVAGVTRLIAGSTPGPDRALAFRGGASLTCSNIRPSGGDRDASPRLSNLSAFTLLFRLRVDEIRSVAIGGSPLPIFQIDRDGDCGFAVILQPNTGAPYDRLQAIVRARKNGSSTVNQSYYGNMGVHGGPLLSEIDPEPGPFVTFGVRVNFTGNDGRALTLFREGQQYSAEGLNGAAPQYLHDEDSRLQLTFGAPSELSPGYPSEMRRILGDTGYADSRGGDFSITADRIALYDVPLTDEQVAALADSETPFSSVQPNHLIFCPDGRGTRGDAADLGTDGTLVNRGVVDLDVPRDGRIMWRDSASALVDVPSTMGVSGRGGVYLEEAPGLVTSARIRRAVLNASGSIYVELEDNDGNDVDLAASNTYSHLMDAVAPEVEVTIARAGGGVVTWNPWSIWVPSPSFGSSDPKGHFLLLPPRDVDPPGPGDSASIAIPDGWIVSSLGATAGVDASLVVGSILPDSASLIPAGERLDVGFNLSMMDHGFPGIYADRIKHGYRPLAGEYTYLPVDGKGWPVREPGQVANIVVTLPADQLWADPYFTQAHLDPPHLIPGRPANPLLGEDGGEFEGLRPSSGTRTIPRKGKFYAVITPKVGREAEADVRWAFNNYAPFTTPGYTSSADQATGQPNPCFASFTDSAGILIDPNTGKYYRVWSYECWDPQNNPAHEHAIGWYTTPKSHVHITEAVAEVEAYFVPDEGTEHAAYRFNPFNPPLFDPEFTKGKMQGGACTLFRFLNASNGNSTGASLASDFAPPDYASLMIGRDRPNPWTTLVPIASVAIPTAAEVAAAAGFDRMARNVYVKITTTTPHGLAHGAKFETRGDLIMGIPREPGEEGETSGVVAFGNAIVLTPTTIMATVAAQKSIGGPVATTGVVSGTPSENFLLRPIYPHLPLEHLARFADEACPAGGGKVWFNLNHSLLQFDPYDVDGDGQVDGSYLQQKLMYERMVQDAPAGVKFILEPGNEIWNPGNAFYYGGEHFRMLPHRCYGHGAVIRPKTYDGSGGITAWEVVTPGRGYFNGEPRIHSGSGAGFHGLLRTNPLTGAVEGVHVVAPGSGYGAPNTTIEGGDPSVVVSIGKGRGAVLTPVISGRQITGITIANGGSGYRGGLLRIVGGSGSGASASFTVDGSGAINSIAMHAGGSGYLPGDSIHVETPHSLAYGDEPWGGSDQRDAYMANMLTASRAVRLFREVLIEDGRSPDDVEAYIGLGPADFIAPAVQAALAFCNGSGDPLDRLDSAGQHTYWNLSIPAGMPVAIMSQFTTEEDMDLFELEAAHVRLLDQTLAAGFPKVYVYEGGLDTYNPYDLDVQGEGGDSAGLYRRVLRCMAPHYHPRMHRVELAFLRRMHDDGVAAYCVYEAVNTWRRGGLTGPSYHTSPTLSNFYAQWGKYNGGYGEVPGRGDGSDGKHDNRFATNGYAGMFNPGVSVIPELAAHKTWVSGQVVTPTPTNPTPTPTNPTPTPTNPTPTPTNPTPTPTNPTPGDGSKHKYAPKSKGRPRYPWSSGPKANPSSPWRPALPRRIRRKGWPKSE